jgi:hypothetical protein
MPRPREETWQADWLWPTEKSYRDREREKAGYWDITRCEDGEAGTGSLEWRSWSGLRFGLRFTPSQSALQ